MKQLYFIYVKLRGSRYTIDDNEQERDSSATTSPRKRNGLSAQEGDDPSSKRFTIITEDEEYKYSPE